MKSGLKILHFFLLLSIISYSDMHAQAFLESIKNDLENYKRKTDKERVFIIADKDVYTPGDNLWFSAIAYKVSSPEISQKSTNFTIEVLNSEFEVILEDGYDIINGRVNSHMILPTDLMDGVYYLHGKTERSVDEIKYRRKIIVKEKILPPFITYLSFIYKDYNPGESVPFSLAFENHFNDPQKGVSYHATFYDGNAVISEYEGKVKKEGTANFDFKIPANLNTGIITYQIHADDKGIGSALNGIFQAMPSDILIDFYPDNGRLVHGLSSVINIFSYYDLGRPVAVEADLLRDGKVIASLKTENNGFGSFELTPETGGEYAVQISKPVLIEKLVSFPEVAEKGVVLSLVERSENKLIYKLKSAYEEPRLIYLVGLSDGEIFWYSEHNIANEETVEVDLTEANGVMGHFVALNAASWIEGEQIVAIKSSSEATLEVSLSKAEFSERSKVMPNVNLSSDSQGELVIAAVNIPWILEGIDNAHPSIISLPGNAIQQQVVSFYASLEMDEKLLEILLPYYEPTDFGWSKILNTNGCFNGHVLDKDVLRYQQFIDQFAGKYHVTQKGNEVTHSNLLVSESFLISNPKFSESLEYEKAEKIPPYKQLLERGNVPIIDVLNTIKPCKQVGSGIQVFSTNTGLGGGGGASLIVIDGIPRGYDGALITGMNPRNIEKITISTQAVDILKYSGFNTGAVIEVVTKEGDEKTKPPVKINKNEQFSSPDYEARKGGGDDFRSTIYWNVNQVGTGTKTFDVNYFNADLLSTVQLKVYYLPNRGIPAYFNLEYVVTKE